MLFGIDGITEKAIERIKTFAEQAETMHSDGYYVAFSGGKDSIVILDLVKRAGVKYTAHYNVTTVDPPELIRFIRREHPTVIWDRPEKSMFQLIVEKGFPPTRFIRYCCEHLKERWGADRFVVTGVRWAESLKRKQRKMTEACFRDNRRMFLHPIIDWTDNDVWDYIRENKLPYCELYDKGMKRIGCVGCPMNTRQREELDRYPKYKNAYLKAFRKLLDKKIAQGTPLTWQTPEELLAWWVAQKRTHKESENQTMLIYE